MFTGLLTEPGSKTLTVNIWGYNSVTKKWTTFIIDFQKVLKNQCSKSIFFRYLKYFLDLIILMYSTTHKIFHFFYMVKVNNSVYCSAFKKLVTFLAHLTQRVM